MRWIDIEDISEALEAAHPDCEISSLRFTALRAMVLSLEGFADEPARCNEKILEAIQAEWMELRG